MINQVSYNYVSIDIETLGLDPNNNKVIEIACVLDNSKHRINYKEVDSYVANLPTFHCYIAHESYDGNAKAIEMNQKAINLIKEGKHSDIVNINDVSLLLTDWFKGHNVTSRIMPAGKNFAGFDRPFLENIVGVKKCLNKLLIHRTLDPALYFFDANVDAKIPDMQQCFNKAGIHKTVSHTAVDDAQDVIKLLRYNWDKT
jgi:oligoribonuclease (3'-5' exoribonuclease)